MSASVVAALICAVLAAVGAGVLVGRSIRVPRMDIPAWACTLAGLAVALFAQALGTYHGYASGTFRAVQFGAQLIAPLWLAWGLAELTAKSAAARFGAKLVTMALTVVTGVVLLTDPLSSAPFGKSWPAASAHYQIIPRSLLSLIAGVTLAAVVVAVIFAVLRLRSDPAWRQAIIPISAAGIGAVAILGLRLTLPNAAYLALCAGCAALTWLAGQRADKIGLAELRGEVPHRRTDRSDRQVAAPLGESEADDSFGRGAEFGGHRRFGDRYGDDHRHGDDDWFGPARENQTNSWHAPEGGYRHNGGIAMNGLREEDRGYEPDDPGQGGLWRPGTFGGAGLGDPGLGGAGLGDPGLGDPGFGDPGLGGPGLGGAGLGDPGLGDPGLGGPGLGGPGLGGAGLGDPGLGDPGLGGAGLGDPGLGDPGLGGAGLGDPGLGGPGLGGPGLGDPGLGGAGRGDNGGLGAGSAGLGDGSAGLGGGNGGLGGGNAGLGTGSAVHVAATAPTGPQPTAGAAADAAGTAADQAATERLYGLIAIYTLAEGTAADFDALAERVVEEVRSREPDALVYAVHSVPNADMQRIFYEVYRDRMAYEDHQRLPHIQRFETERGPYVLATNIIELGMQQAKLSPLPGLSELFGRPPGA